MLLLLDSLLPAEYQELSKVMKLAGDSYVFNPHKWMFFTTLLYQSWYLKEPRYFGQYFFHDSEYLKTDLR